MTYYIEILSTIDSIQAAVFNILFLTLKNGTNYNEIAKINKGIIHLTGSE